MYSLKVRGVVAAGDPSAVPDAPTSSASPATSRPASPRQRDHLHDEVDQVSFSAGNPRVEHITGVVHLYRHIPGPGEATPSAAALEDAGLASAPLPSERSEQLCVLSLPPDMGFPEFCAFLGSYFDQVQEVRLVRREGDASTSCLVLVRFAAQEAADGFYTEFNGKPVSVCHRRITHHSISHIKTWYRKWNFLLPCLRLNTVSSSSTVLPPRARVCMPPALR